MTPTLLTTGTPRSLPGVFPLPVVMGGPAGANPSRLGGEAGINPSSR